MEALNANGQKRITEVGQPCRHCGTPVIEKRHSKPPKDKPNGGGYYFNRWLKCPKCRALYMLEDEKVWFPERRANFAALFSTLDEKEDWDI